MLITQDVAAIAEQLHQGNVVAYPTEAVFGLGCDPSNLSAVEQLLAIKQRPIEKGIILVASQFDQVSPYIAADFVATEQQKAPDNITWVYPVADGVSPLLRGQFDSIAIRITKHPLVRALCDITGHAITSTSANISGETPCYTAEEVFAQFNAHTAQPAAILDGPTSGQLNPTEIRDAVSGAILRHS